MYTHCLKYIITPLTLKYHSEVHVCSPVVWVIKALRGWINCMYMYTHVGTSWAGDIAYWPCHMIQPLASPTTTWLYCIYVGTSKVLPMLYLSYSIVYGAMPCACSVLLGRGRIKVPLVIISSVLIHVACDYNIEWRAVFLLSIQARAIPLHNTQSIHWYIVFCCFSTLSTSQNHSKCSWSGRLG